MEDRDKLRVWCDGEEGPIITDLQTVLTGQESFHPGALLNWDKCLGRIDKNGKLIFEGDIIKQDRIHEYTKEEYWEPEFIIVWELLGFASVHCGGGLPGANLDFTLKYYSHCDIEVIGNIYENPELPFALEGKTTVLERGQEMMEGKMPRVLVTAITTCDACPWFNPGWAAVGGLTEAKSLCCHPNFENEKNKNRQIDRMAGREMAWSRVPETIPAWCPLPEKEPI